ncbi:hypothetical protein L1049_002712 [Liquidambar formosana]|uniref:RNase H type-1 domain-containing protein n=1 Tax=Liquidambar formosana TaxID=63359 RepID=A0AAP0R9D5_LIQFO
MAVRFAMGLARDLGLHSVEVEGDSLEVINAFTATSVLLTLLGLIIEDILIESASSFAMVSFSHIRREGNAVAHSLARYAQDVEDFCVWIEEVPNFVRDTFLVDLQHCFH